MGSVVVNHLIGECGRSCMRMVCTVVKACVIGNMATPLAKMTVNHNLVRLCVGVCNSFINDTHVKWRLASQ